MKIRRFARWYHAVEYLAFGRGLERARFHFLDRLGNARRILVLGEGDGRALERLLVAAPVAEIEVIEISAAMADLARRRTGDSPMVCFRVEDARRCEPGPECYDAVVTLFFLDCFDEAGLGEILGRFAPQLVPGGLWLVSDFAIPARGWQRLHAQAWIGVMYRFFGVVSGLQVRELPMIDRAFAEAGFRLDDARVTRAGLIQAAVWHSGASFPGGLEAAGPDRLPGSEL